MSQEALLRVNNIDVFYGSLQVLWDISLVVNKGEYVAVIGGNGSGKSTLFGAILGEVHPAKGSIEFKGKDITGLPAFQTVGLGISLVPEGRRLFPDMTVLENLIIGSYTRKARYRREESLGRVYNLFPRLEERKKQLAKTLSGGERQMLAIGRGLMSNPTLLVIDELSLGLSPIAINDIYESLKQIRGEVTILLVEQNVQRSLKEADRAYVMEAGHIVLSGKVEDLREEDKIKKAYFGVKD